MGIPLTGPMGIPSAVLNSSDRFPGFFSFSRVSNSLPLNKKQSDTVKVEAVLIIILALKEEPTRDSKSLVNSAAETSEFK